MLSFFVFLVGTNGRGQEPTKADRAKPIEATAHDAKPHQGVEKTAAEHLVAEFTRTLRSKIWESLRGPKEAEPITRYIDTSVQFLQEKGFSPEQLTLARATAFNEFWDCINEYAQMLVTSEQAQKEHRETAAKFMKIGENLISEANTRRAALRLAVARGNTKLVDWLAEHGTDLNEKPSGDLTALMFAVIQNDSQMIETLLKHRVDVNLRNAEGLTALMFAVQAGNNEKVKMLLSNGADPSIKDKRGRSALRIAKDNNQLETVVLLKDAGAKE